MKKLILVRHAKSDWSELGKTITRDHDRPLNARGNKNAPQMGQFFKKQKIKPQVIISSSAVRAKTTAHLIAEQFKKPVPIIEEAQLYACTCQTWLEQIGSLEHSYKTVIMVGHNPEISATASHLCAAHIEMVTCAAVCMSFDIDSWQDLSAEKLLKWDHFTPKNI